MKVCVLPAAYKPIPPVKGGAVETIVQNMININENSHDIFFTILSVWDENAERACQNERYTNTVFFRGNEKLDRIYYWCIYKTFKKFLNVILPDYILRLRMVKWISEHQNEFDWILVEAGEIDCFKYYKKMLDTNKIIYHSHGEITNKKRVEKSIHYYMAVSDFIKDTWNNSFDSDSNNSITLINGINQDKFHVDLSITERNKIRATFGFVERDIVLLFVGRVIQEKGVLELLNAMTLLPDNYKLLIIGSSNFGTTSRTKYEKEVYSKIEKLKNRVSFTGYIPNERIGVYYKISDISVIPSMFEDPAPLVVIEAMASGLPIVTTGSGGIKEYCDYNCAVFVERDNNISQSIASAVEHIGGDYSKRMTMSKYAIEKAKAFTDINQFNNLLQYLKELER